MELQRLIGIRQADGIDAGRVADLLDAELAARAEAVERAVDVVRVHDVVFLVHRVGDRGQVDDGVAALEGFHGRCVIGCRVCGAHLRVGDAEFVLLFCAVHLHCRVPGFCT